MVKSPNSKLFCRMYVLIVSFCRLSFCRHPPITLLAKLSTEIFCKSIGPMALESQHVPHIFSRQNKFNSEKIVSFYFTSCRENRVFSLKYINADWKICQYFRYRIKIMLKDFTLKLVLRFEIRAREICESFIYKHSETIEYIKNQPTF